MKELIEIETYIIGANVDIKMLYIIDRWSIWGESHIKLVEGKDTKNES